MLAQSLAGQEKRESALYVDFVTAERDQEFAGNGHTEFGSGLKFREQNKIRDLVAQFLIHIVGINRVIHHRTVAVERNHDHCIDLGEGKWRQSIESGGRLAENTAEQNVVTGLTPRRQE